MAVFPDNIPSFVTSRLIIRPLQEEYLPFLQEIWAQTVNQPVNNARGRTIFMLLDNMFFNRQGLCWVLMEKSRGEIIGTCEFHNFSAAYSRSDVGCELTREARRQGYMTEALNELTKYAFNELALYDIVANIEPDNQASLAFFQRLGFEPASDASQRSGLRKFVLSRKIE